MDGWMKGPNSQRNNQLIWNWLNLYRMAHSLFTLLISHQHHNGKSVICIYYSSTLYINTNTERSNNVDDERKKNNVLNKQRQIAIDSNNSNARSRSSEKFHYRKLVRQCILNINNNKSHRTFHLVQGTPLWVCAMCVCVYCYLSLHFRN